MTEASDRPVAGRLWLLPFAVTVIPQLVFICYLFMTMKCYPAPPSSGLPLGDNAIEQDSCSTVIMLTGTTGKAVVIISIAAGFLTAIIAKLACRKDLAPVG